jgi:hypothetical protein
VPRSALPLSHEQAPEVLLGRKGVVLRTTQTQVRRVVCPTLREGFHVVELEAMRFSAALSPIILVGATTPIALEHRTAYRGRNSAAALAFRALGVRASRLFRHGVATLLEIAHERSHRAQVKILERRVRSDMGKERPGSFDERHVLFAGAELHAVPLRSGDGIGRLSGGVL